MELGGYMSSTEPGSDFEIANDVAQRIKGISRERQHKVLRWVAESVDMIWPTLPGAPTGTAPALETSATPAVQMPGRARDIKSFVEAKKPKSDMQFAAVVAYYYQFEAPAGQRLQNISAEILQDAARLASRPRLRRPLTTLNNAKSQGYLDAVGRGEFRINSVGENLVAMALPAAEAPGSLPRTKSPTKRSGRKNTKSKPSKGRSKQQTRRRTPGR